MRRTLLSVLLLATLVHAQSSVEDRRKALSNLYAQYWDALLDHSPEFASAIGDNRFADKLSDLSPKAANDWIAREQDMMMKLGGIDTTGLSAAEAKSHDSLLTQFTNDIETSGSTDWQLPTDANTGIYLHYPDLAAKLTFADAKDYDAWTARLHALPGTIDQLIANMGSSIDQRSVPAKPLLDRDLAQIKALAAQKPEETPFAAPLKQMPASIPAAEQQRIKQETLDAITKGVLPAYQRLARFFDVSYIPAAGAAASAAQPAAQKPAQDFTWQSREAHILAELDHAREALGPKFSMKAFHDLVSTYGVLPPETLDERVTAWIASQK